MSLSFTQLTKKLKSRITRFISRSLGLKRVESRLRAGRSKLIEEIKGINEHGNCLSFHANQSIRHLETTSQVGGVALVTILPPQQSGLATFALRLASENPGKLDLFSTFSKIEDFLVIRGLLGNQTPTHPIDMLLEAVERRKYEAIVFSIGNSNHNVPIAEAVRRWAPRIQRTRKYLQVHDPVIFNLARRTLNDSGILDEAYATAYPSLETKYSNTSEEMLLEKGITGFSALFGGCEVDEIIVHSSAAAKLLTDDMAKGSWSRPIRQLFHPVFKSTIREIPAIKFPFARPVLGVFGVPSRDKRIDVVVEAVTRGIDQGRLGTALFAGYNADVVRSMFPSAYESRIATVTNPDDMLLEHLMQASDVAVQLRSRNLGESSGVIPQLIELGIPVVVSNVGSFIDYGSVVEMVEPNVNADDLLDAIDALILKNALSGRHVHNYVEQHRSGEFLRRLTETVSV